MASNRKRLSAEDVLHRLEIQEGFADEYCANLDEESGDEDEISEGDFTTSDGQQMLIDSDMLTGKGFAMLSQLSTPAEQDSLLILDKKWEKRSNLARYLVLWYYKFSLQ